MSRADFAVPAPKLKFEVCHLAILIEQSFQTAPISGIHIKLAGRVDAEQFLFAFEAVEAHQGVVAIKQLPIGRDNKYAFLCSFKKTAEFVFRQPHAGEILEHVNRAQPPAFRTVQGGIGNQEIPAKRRVRFVGLACNAFAIGTAAPVGSSAPENIANPFTDNGNRLQMHTLAERAVRANNLAVAGMDQDQIVDRVERVAPLAPGICGGFKRADILNRQAQEVGDISEEMLLVAFKSSSA